MDGACLDFAQQVIHEIFIGGSGNRLEISARRFVYKEMLKFTFAFGAMAAFFALKYLLMPLLIFFCFSSSSSRFRLAVARQLCQLKLRVL